MPIPPAAWTANGTVLVYRNIVLANCITKEFTQNAEYETSKTDLLQTNFRVTVESYIHEQDLEGFGVYTESAGIPGYVVPSATAQETAARIHAWMMHPRGDFTFMQESRIVLEIRGPATLPLVDGQRQLDVDDAAELQLYDVANGPHPVSCNVTHIPGYRSYRIEFTIGGSLALCDPDLLAADTEGNPDFPLGVQNNRAVLNNKWSIVESRDSDLLMTQVVTGLLQVRAYTTYAMIFRRLCLPTQRRGFQRVKMSFVQSPDGLSLRYTIVDKQRYAAPPRPAIDWKATHTEMVEGYGTKGVATLSIWLQGTIDCPKAQLLNAALATVEHRIGDIKKDGAVGGEALLIPLSMTLVDTLDRPEIQLTVVIARRPEGLLKYANIMYDVLGKLPAVNANYVPVGGDEEDRNDKERIDDDPTEFSQYNRDAWVTPIPFDGDIPAGMFATYLQDPCIGFHGMPYTAPGAPEGDYPGADENPQPAPTITIYEGDAEGTYPSPDEKLDNQLSDEHVEFPYSHYEIESKYVTVEGFQAFPLAAPQATPTSPMICIGRVSHPITYRDVWIRGKRAGRKPEVPIAPSILTDANGITETLVSKTIIPSAPQLLANGQLYEHEIEASYRYILDRTPTDAEVLRCGSLPENAGTAEEEAFALEPHQTDRIINFDSPAP